MSHDQLPQGANIFSCKVTHNGHIGEERNRLYAKQASVDRRFAEFQANTGRTIPVITLLRTEKGAVIKMQGE